MSDWRDPFLKLKQQLIHLYDSNLSIYHTVVLSPTKDVTALERSLSMLEPVLQGHKMVKDIRVKTVGCQFHAHRFYGSSRNGLDKLERELVGIEEWCDRIPGGMIPAFSIPHLSRQTDRNLLRWVSLVYYLAWSSEAPYLAAEVEYQLEVDKISFFPWYECPHPGGWQPLQWLIHQSSSDEVIPKWQERFREHGDRVPDIIDAYLTDEFIRSSIAAIDILTRVLSSERRQSNQSDSAEVDRLDLRKQPTKKILQETIWLCSTLEMYHDPDRDWIDPSGALSERNAFEKLKSNEIAKLLDWKTEGGRLEQEKVSRRMEEIFGSKPMKKYGDFFKRDDKNKGLLDFLKIRWKIEERDELLGLPPEEVKEMPRSVRTKLRNLHMQRDEEM